jgi:hypothetical protein
MISQLLMEHCRLFLVKLGVACHWGYHIFSFFLVDGIPVSQIFGCVGWVIGKAATDMQKQLAGNAHSAAGLQMGWAMLDESSCPDSAAPTRIRFREHILDICFL